MKGKFPAILEEPAARELYDDAQELLDEIVRDGCSRRAASTASGRRRPTATISLSTMTTATRFCFLRQQSAYGDSRPEPLASPTTSRRDGRPHRRVRGHRRHRPRRARRPVRGRARRLPLDHGEGARRPPRRGVRRVPARASRGVSGTRRGEQLSPEQLSEERSAASGRRSATRRAPTTPRSAKLFELLGAEDVGITLTETFAMMPGRERQRHLPRRIRRRATSPSAASGATRSRTTPRARACRSPRSRDGCARTSRTSRADAAAEVRPSAAYGEPSWVRRREGGRQLRPAARRSRSASKRSSSS